LFYSSKNKSKPETLFKKVQNVNSEKVTLEKRLAIISIYFQGLNVHVMLSAR